MKNQANVIHAQIRTSTGKGAARKARKAGYLPCVVYAGGRDAQSVAVFPKEISKLLHSPMRRNVLIELDVKDAAGKDLEPKTVMVRDLQIDPIRRELIHLDFVEVDPKNTVDVDVPLHTFGKSKAVTAGGKLEQATHQLKIRALPTQIPANIEIDITDLKMGSTHASDIKLPSDVELVTNPSAAVINIKVPKGGDDDLLDVTATEGEADAAAAPADAEKKESK